MTVGGGKLFFGITIQKLIFVCIAMFIAGFIDSIAGGGGCISLPAYLLSGLPPTVSFACNKTSACIGTSVATLKYLKGGKIDLKVTAISAVCGIIGSNIGARVLLTLDPVFLQKMIVCVIPFVALFLILKKDFGNENDFASVPTAKVWIVSVLSGLILGLYDGIIGPGTGTFAIMIFASVLKFDLKTASGNSKLLNFCTGFGSFIHYLFSGIIIWPVVICTAAANIAGNYIGSSLALKKNPSFIRIVMIVVVAILLAKLGYDAFLTV